MWYNLNKRLCPLICLYAPQPISLSVYPSVSSLVPPYHFTWRVETKIASDFCRAYGIVINPKMVSQESLSANLYVCQSISLSIKTAAHASYHDLQLDIGNTNGGFTGFFCHFYNRFFFFFHFLNFSNKRSCFVICKRILSLDFNIKQRGIVVSLNTSNSLVLTAYSL